MRHLNNDQSGFSLMEVMVAFGVLAIGIVGACSVLFSCYKLNESTHLRSTAVFYARQKLDGVLIGLHPETEERIDILSANGVYFNVPGLHLKSADSSVQPGLVTVSENLDFDGAYEITVQVTWTVPYTSDNNSIELKTIVCN